MPQHVSLIPAGTAAVTTPQAFDTAELSALSVVAFGLAGAETFGVKVYDFEAEDWDDVYVDGAALTLTATAPGVVLEGGPRYGFTKDATAGAAGLQGHPRIR